MYIIYTIYLKYTIIRITIWAKNISTIIYINIYIYIYI